MNLKNRKYIVRLEGGLGNQLFQYAHAKALALKHGGDVYLDTHTYTPKQIRSLSLQHFHIPKLPSAQDLTWLERLWLLLLQMAHKLWMTILLKWPGCIGERGFVRLARLGLHVQYKTRLFPSFPTSAVPINYVSGNWLSAGFFQGAEQMLREELTIKEDLSPESQAVLEKIKTTSSVCIHVRLGDYLEPAWRDKLYICTETYYQQAVEYLKTQVENPVFFVFSNRHEDFLWIQEHLHLQGEVRYVDLGNKDYQDLLLMSSCRHFIMSNSTYSWWAQWLGDFPDKRVVAPSRFNNYPRWDLRDIYLDNWHLIPT